MLFLLKILIRISYCGLHVTICMTKNLHKIVSKENQREKIKLHWKHHGILLNLVFDEEIIFINHGN